MKSQSALIVGRWKARPLLRIHYGCESRNHSGLTQTPYNLSLVTGH